MSTPEHEVKPNPAVGSESGAATQPKGLVFQIIHGSFVDGPGIRTTIFLKGCPLSCLWCCNPEGQKRHVELKVTAALCNGCGNCLPVCPENAIRLGNAPGDDPIVVDRVRCTNCLKCVDVCYADALDSFGVYYTVNELFELVRKDERYYSDSGGGVTIGGGEPTLQPAFVRAFLRKCKETLHPHRARYLRLHHERGGGEGAGRGRPAAVRRQGARPDTALRRHRRLQRRHHRAISSTRTT